MDNTQCQICGAHDGEQVNDVHGERTVKISATETLGEAKWPVCEHCVRFLSHAGNSVEFEKPAELGTEITLPEIKGEL